MCNTGRLQFSALQLNANQVLERKMNDNQSSMFSAKGRFLKLKFASLLGKFAGCAAEGSAAVAASSSLDVIARADASTVHHLVKEIVQHSRSNTDGGGNYLQNKSNTTPCEESVNHAVG